MRTILKESPVEISILVLLVALCGFLVAVSIDAAVASRTVVGTGTVIEKVYCPEILSHGVGVNVRNGGATPITTYSSESWVVIAQFNDKTFSTNCTADEWARYEKGGSCNVFRIHGMFGDYGYTLKQ